MTVARLIWCLASGFRTASPSDYVCKTKYKKAVLQQRGLCEGLSVVYEVNMGSRLSLTLVLAPGRRNSSSADRGWLPPIESGVGNREKDESMFASVVGVSLPSVTHGIAEIPKAFFLVMRIRWNRQECPQGRTWLPRLWAFPPSRLSTLNPPSRRRGLWTVTENPRRGAGTAH